MKKLVSGISFLFIGVFSYISLLFIGFNYVSNITEWDSSKGKLFVALSELKLIPSLFISIGFIIIGFVIITYSLIKNNKT